MLDENEYFLQAIKEYQSQSRSSVAFEYSTFITLCRYQKRLNKNINALLQIYNNQKLRNAVQPTFQIVTKPLPSTHPKKRSKTDSDLADDTNTLDMPAII